MNVLISPLFVTAAPKPVTVLFQNVDLKTVQTVDARLPAPHRFLPTRITAVGKSITALSVAPTFGLHPAYAFEPTDAVAAALETNLTGSNNDLTFTAVTPGAAGNDITVTYVNPGTPSAALAVALSGTDLTVNLATDAGVQQVETATAVGTITGISQVETATVAGGATADADVIVTVTGAGITGSPLAVNVAVANLDTAADVAGKIRAALALEEDITALYTVGGSGADITLTRTTTAADDATLNIAIDGTSNSTGVPDAATSADTTAGEASGAGNAAVTVTGAGIAGSPLTVNVAVAAGDTAATWAGKVRTALGNTAAITALYTVGGSGADITLTRTVAAANDATLNIALADGTSDGITEDATSTDTTAGVAPAITSTAAQIKAALEAYGAFNALLTVAHKTGNDGTGVVTAMSEDALEGGSNDVPGAEGSDFADSDPNPLGDLETDVAVNVPLGTIPLFQTDGLLRLKITVGATATTALADIVVEGVML